MLGESDPQRVRPRSLTVSLLLQRDRTVATPRTLRLPCQQANYTLLNLSSPQILGFPFFRVINAPVMNHSPILPFLTPDVLPSHRVIAPPGGTMARSRGTVSEGG